LGFGAFSFGEGSMKLHAIVFRAAASALAFAAAGTSKAEPPRAILIDPSTLTKLPPVSQPNQSPAPLGEALSPPAVPAPPQRHPPIDVSAMQRDSGFSPEALLDQRLANMEKRLAELQKENAALQQQLDDTHALLNGTYKRLYDYTQNLRPFGPNGVALGLMIQQTWEKIVTDKVCD
jgi:hypothetical protein